MRDKIRSIISEVFRVDLSSLPRNPDPDTVERWDSLGHLKLIARLEEEYKIDIPQNKLIFMTSEDEIIAILSELVSK